MYFQQYTQNPLLCFHFSNRYADSPNVTKMHIYTAYLFTVPFYYRYRQYIVKYNSIIDFTKVYFLHCFVQRHVSALVMSHLQVD